MNRPLVTFGIIVLNGEPYTRYNLRALYDFAYEIIVVEGASIKAKHSATSDGHSIDGTLEILQKFKNEEDPEGKITIVTAENEGYPNGFWPGDKDEQSQAYAKRATGEWLWQVDIDEFYHPRDMLQVCRFLNANTDIGCLSFNAYHFWGGFDYLVRGGLFMNPSFQGEPWGAYRRVFKWGLGYRYLTHRPPTVVDSSGRDITRDKIINMSKTNKKHPIFLYHYFMVFPSQALRKGEYYDHQGWGFVSNVRDRYEMLFNQIDYSSSFKIFTHFGTKNWLVRFNGEHPDTILTMISDVMNNEVEVESRQTDDIEILLQNSTYEALSKLIELTEYAKAVGYNLKYYLRKFLLRSSLICKLLKRIRRNSRRY